MLYVPERAFLLTDDRVRSALRRLGFRSADFDDEIRANIVPGLGGALAGVLANSFVQYTSVYASPVTSASEPIPSGATQCVIEIWGATSGGGKSAVGVFSASGSGGGGYAKLTKTVLPGEWGSNLSVTVAAKGTGSTVNGNGTQATTCLVTGTLNGGAIAPQVTGSAYGQQSGAARAGGIASGGDINTNGSSGGVGDATTVNGAGGSGASGSTGGAGGARGAGSGGGYTNGVAGGTNGADGVDGRITITWKP